MWARLSTSTSTKRLCGICFVHLWQDNLWVLTRTGLLTMHQTSDGFWLRRTSPCGNNLWLHLAEIYPPPPFGSQRGSSRCDLKMGMTSRRPSQQKGDSPLTVWRRGRGGLESAFDSSGITSIWNIFCDASPGPCYAKIAEPIRVSFYIRYWMWRYLCRQQKNKDSANNNPEHSQRGSNIYFYPY